MDDLKVTACDTASALSQSAYVLFYIQRGELERATGGASADRAPRSPGADPIGRDAAVGEPRSPSSIRVSASEGPLAETDIQEITLEQWRRHQEHSRPKAEFNLRKVEPALPTNAVVIHRSKFGDGTGRILPEHENFQVNTSTRGAPPQGPKNMGSIPCLGGRAKASRKNNKKQKPLALQ